MTRDHPHRRGQAEVIGLIILLGLVAIASVSVLIVGQSAVSDTQQEAELERVESAFVQLSHEIAGVTTNSEMPREVYFDVGENGAITKTEAGTITIKGGNVHETISLGAIEYEHDDGSIVAYQAGGVWSERGEETRMVSPPPISYDPIDETLTLPVTNMNEEKDLSSGVVRTSLSSIDPVRGANIVEDDTITMEIESPYYRGWERYFRTAVGDGAIRDVDHDDERVVVEFGYDSIDNAVDRAATVGSADDEYFDDDHGHFENSTSGTLMPEMDPVIDELLDDALDSNDTIELGESSTQRLEDGTHYVDEVAGDVDYEFNLTNGSATLLIDGDVNLGEDASITVTDRDPDEENVLRIYSNGDLFTIDGTVCVEESDGTCSGDASGIQFYGPASMAVDGGPGEGGTFEGLLYVAAPEEQSWWDHRTGYCGEQHQVAFQAGDLDFTGSVVAYSVCAQSNAVTVEHDSENLDTLDFEPYPDGYVLPPQITYLNVAIYDVAFDD